MAGAKRSSSKGEPQRRACDFCRRQKRGCDHKVQCGQCKKRGITCTYSFRRPEDEGQSQAPAPASVIAEPLKVTKKKPIVSPVPKSQLPVGGVRFTSAARPKKRPLVSDVEDSIEEGEEDWVPNGTTSSSAAPSRPKRSRRRSVRVPSTPIRDDESSSSSEAEQDRDTGRSGEGEGEQQEAGWGGQRPSRLADVLDDESLNSSMTVLPPPVRRRGSSSCSSSTTSNIVIPPSTARPPMAVLIPPNTAHDFNPPTAPEGGWGGTGAGELGTGWGRTPLGELRRDGNPPPVGSPTRKGRRVGLMAKNTAGSSSSSSGSIGSTSVGNGHLFAPSYPALSDAALEALVMWVPPVEGGMQRSTSSSSSSSSSVSNAGGGGGGGGGGGRSFPSVTSWANYNGVSTGSNAGSLHAGIPGRGMSIGGDGGGSGADAMLSLGSAGSCLPPPIPTPRGGLPITRQNSLAEAVGKLDEDLHSSMDDSVLDLF